MNSLKDRFISGVAWAAIGRFSSLIIQFIVTIVIARILTPSDYGTIGLLTIFIALGGIILDSGFSQALIQKKNATNIDFSTIFYFNLLIGVILYIFFYFFSPYIALFFNIHELTMYARILFLIIPINSFAIIQNVIMHKQMNFRRIAIINMSSALISGIIGISAAYSNQGIMSLVYQQISMSLCTTIFFISLNRWIPLFSVSLKSIKEMAPFSISILFTSAITIVFSNIYTIIIGRYFSSKEVGFYNQAKRFEGITATTITDIILQVSFPLFVNYSSDIQLLKNVYRKVILMSIFIVCPMMCLLICAGEELFYVLLTDKWLPAVPYFQLLCIFGIMLPLHRINTNIFKVFKCGKMILNIEIARRVIIIISIILTIKHGIYALLIGQIVSMFIIVIINMHYSGKLIDYSVLEQLRDIIPCYLISIVTTLITYYIFGFIHQPLWTIVIKTIFMGIIYLWLSSIFNSESFSKMTELIKQYFPFKTNKRL
jgi:O-antigen/teichoic acid export membrane protein